MNATLCLTTVTFVVVVKFHDFLATKSSGHLVYPLFYQNNINYLKKFLNLVRKPMHTLKS